MTAIARRTRRVFHLAAMPLEGNLRVFCNSGKPYRLQEAAERQEETNRCSRGLPSGRLRREGLLADIARR
jgi:hypothetical protein